MLTKLENIFTEKGAEIKELREAGAYLHQLGASCLTGTPAGALLLALKVTRALQQESSAHALLPPPFPSLFPAQLVATLPRL